jgi:murein DD-endopeptidase MepM/ murein hydrolase activator NlpD
MTGYPIYATHYGTVLSVEDGVVSMRLIDGTVTRHFHLHDIAVRPGDQVAWGQLLGHAG